MLEAPFSSARDVAARVLPVLGPLVIWSYNSKQRIAHVRAPLLIMHGDRDEVIPFDLGRALFDAAPEAKSFWAIPGAGHKTSFRSRPRLPRPPAGVLSVLEVIVVPPKLAAPRGPDATLAFRDGMMPV